MNTEKNDVAGLFGLTNSNRDFSNPDSWGKNQFNSSFPAALGCYMASKGLAANYICLVDGKLEITEISIEEVFGSAVPNDSVFFAFEESFEEFEKFSDDQIPRTDLVIEIPDAKKQTAALEIKLTALPDVTTHHLGEDEYGSELVIRPDTIFYLVAAIANANRDLVKTHFAPSKRDKTVWSSEAVALAKYASIHGALDDLIRNVSVVQTPAVLHPVWKTKGKSAELADDCLDLFVWSASAFLCFLLEIAKPSGERGITRLMRSVIWAYVTLREIGLDGKTDFSSTIDRLSYNTKNDKAFSATGSVTHRFMKHKNLETPRIRKSEISSIILGGGQNFLSPERRFDAIVVNSPDLFDA